jgi:serine/threonine-protein kinase
MRNDIERYLDGRPISVVAAPATPAAGTTMVTGQPTGQTAVVPLVDDPDDDTGPRMGIVIAAALAVLVVVIAAIFFWPKLFPSAPAQVQVPNVVNLTESEARQKIGDAQLQPDVQSYEPSDSVPAGSVIRESPQSETYVNPGSIVHIVLSNGKPQVTIPQIVGMKFPDAQAQLQQLQLNVKKQMVDSDQPKGQVIQSDPAPGAQARVNDTVTLSVSRGPKQVPSVVGLAQQDAINKIQAAGFVATVQPDSTSTKPAGTVTSQFPNAGTTLNKGQSVLVTVSTYTPPPSPSTTPTNCITPTPGVPTQPTDPPVCTDPTTGLPVG